VLLGGLPFPGGRGRVFVQAIRSRFIPFLRRPNALPIVQIFGGRGIMGHRNAGRQRRKLAGDTAGRSHREMGSPVAARLQAATVFMASLGGILTNGQEAMGATGSSIEYVFTNGGVMNEILACIGCIIFPLILFMGLACLIVTRKKQWFRQYLSKPDIYVISFICGIQIYMIISAISISVTQEKLSFSNIITDIFIFLGVILGFYLPYWAICAPFHLPYLFRAWRGKKQRGRRDVIYVTGIFTVVFIYACIFWFANSGVE
jgi:hypothetical protein